MGIVNPSVINFIKFFLRLMGLIYIIIIIFQNHEYITTNKYEENLFISPNDIQENMNIDNQLYKKENVYFDVRKNRRIKTIEISIVKEKKPKFSMRNILYINLDIYGNYFMICNLLYLIKDLENYYLILFGYYFLIILLQTKVNIFFFLI